MRPEATKELQDAARLIAQTFEWAHTPEGFEYWSQVYETLRAMARRGVDTTSHGLGLQPSPNGAYVLYTDHRAVVEKLIKERDEARAHSVAWPRFPKSATVPRKPRKSKAA